MIKNYLKIAIRNLLKYKVYAVINALGLAIGMGSCLFLLVITQYEFSFDQYHVNKERIYRLTDIIRTAENRELHTAASPAPWGPALQQLNPEIESYVRYLYFNNVVRRGDHLFNESIIYSDPAVFDVFTYSLINGNPKTALVNPYSLVMSAKMAKKYFGSEDPMGQTLTIDAEHDYLVTGVMSDVPDNSYFKFDFLASISTLKEQNFEALADWRSHWTHTYLLLRQGASAAAVQARFPDFIKTHIEEEFQQRYRPALQPFANMHLDKELASDWGENLQVEYIYIFCAIALFVLVIACINFMNLATARSAGRSKEVGMRKVLGAFRWQLVRQFLTESVVISFIALVFAIVFVELSLPWFRSLTTREVYIHYFENNLYLFSLFAITLLVGIAAGSYPAFYLSRFRPVTVLKGTQSTTGRGARLRKTLVVAQFTIAIFMIVANFLFYQQIDFLKNKDLGFEKDNIIYFQRPDSNSYSRQMAIKHELLQNPAIRSVFMATTQPGDGSMVGRFIPEGSTQADGMMLSHIAIDENYLPTLKIDVVAGRNFSTQLASDTADVVIINQTAARQFGWENAIGKRIEWMDPGAGNRARTVIGVVKDFHYESLHEPIEPLILHYSPKFLGRYFMSVEGAMLQETYTFLEKQWRSYDPNHPPISYVLDVDLELEYDFEEIMANMLIKFTVITVFIACLGLLGLSSFTAAQRTKEIGIRKVLGANLRSIVTLLSSEFMKLVLIANLIAWPLAYFGMDAWLKNFAYHVEIGPVAFLVCGALALAVAWLTISFQAIRAALANPVESLRYE
ncbi:MAG TPA: ABC transporter permease [bacterium]